MIFEIKPSENSWIKKIYNESMKDLEKFFEIEVNSPKPKITLVPNRKTINLLWNEKTPPWCVAWVWNKNEVYILSPENYEKESSHKFTKEIYKALLKHELAHCFINEITNFKKIPPWLNEGICIYVSGQNAFRKKPSKLENFLEFYNTHNEGVYQESGFAIEYLVEEHGKQKILNLLKKTKDVKNEREFSKVFESIYKFKLNYKNFNR